MKMRECTQPQVVRTQIPGRFANRPRDLGGTQLRLDRCGNAARDLILQFEDMIERGIEAVTPDMSTRRRVDELTGDPHAVAGLPYAALEHITDPQFARYALNFDWLALVGKA